MNPTTITSTVAPIVGMIAAALATKFGLDQNFVATALSAIVSAAATIYIGWSNRQSALVTAVANMPEVSKVELDKSKPATVALNQATPDNVVSK